jgi:uncharacterized membrane protein
MEDDQFDDYFFEQHQMQAPMCATAWTYKSDCNRKCRAVGLQTEIEGWNTPDKVMLIVLVFFAALMTVLILKKRKKMTTKDAVMEQVSLHAAGLHTTHVIGLFALVVLVIAVFAALGLKNITWVMLLGMNMGLFVYLMKLNYDYMEAESEGLVGPDGKLFRNDSDESSVGDGSRSSSRPANANNGTYNLPTIT